jgi:hypothetical protein
MILQSTILVLYPNIHNTGSELVQVCFEIGRLSDTAVDGARLDVGCDCSQGLECSVATRATVGSVAMGGRLKVPNQLTLSFEAFPGRRG